MFFLDFFHKLIQKPGLLFFEKNSVLGNFLVPIGYGPNLAKTVIPAYEDV